MQSSPDLFNPLNLLLPGREFYYIIVFFIMITALCWLRHLYIKSSDWMQGSCITATLTGKNEESENKDARMKVDCEQLRHSNPVQVL